MSFGFAECCDIKDERCETLGSHRDDLDAADQGRLDTDAGQYQRAAQALTGLYRRPQLPVQVTASGVNRPDVIARASQGTGGP